MIVYHASKSVILQPQGRLDAQGGSLLRTQLEAIAPDQHHTWIVDLSNVDFVDSSGLVSLVHGTKRAQQHGCRLVICSLCASVRLLFEITRLDQVFEIFEDHAAAIEHPAPDSQLSPLEMALA